MTDSLDKYRKRRDFKKTPEPAAEVGGGGGNIFVVQKHQASRLHYDLRLEVAGVLKSWAVPKGPSLNPGDKRLAVRTEDHPIGYASFEGRIPKGEYGAGKVIVWDRGTFKKLGEGDVSDALDEGHLSIALKGEKLMGEFSLVHMKGRGEKNWLLMKKADEYADREKDLLESNPESILSGKKVEEV
ncbi:MAG: DNA ligase [Candidatus Altiarchaeales archaeon]|nr:DNA ligase [Candidatus Altiarchaeales archaeon]